MQNVLKVVDGIEKLISANYGYKFNNWVKTTAETDFVNLFITYYGQLDVQINNAKNLAYALESYVRYTDDLSIRDYMVFVKAILEKQNSIVL